MKGNLSMTRNPSVVAKCAGLVLLLVSWGVYLSPSPAAAAGPDTLAAAVVCEKDGTHTVTLTVTNDLHEGKLKHLAGSVSGSRNGSLHFGRKQLRPGRSTTATINGLPGGDPTVANGAAQLAFKVSYTTTAARYTNNLAVLIAGGCPQHFTRLALSAECHNLSGAPGDWRLTERLLNDKAFTVSPTGQALLGGGNSIPLEFSPNPVAPGAISVAATTLPAPSSAQLVDLVVSYGFEGSDAGRLTLPGGACVPAEVRTPKCRTGPQVARDDPDRLLPCRRGL
jgi:hypothetical protein